MNTASPSMLFAVIGQSHSNGNISAQAESSLLSGFLTQWAFLNSENRSLKGNAKTINEIQKLIN